MPRLAANSIEIEYEQFGDSANPPLLLIMGLGGQMILWPDEFCGQLADRGFHVTRFDNRDIGRSTWLTEAGTPDVMTAMMSAMSGGKVGAAYTLSDMAADTNGLLEGLDIDRAHIVGISMGGMIAQTLAIEHPERVRTLTSIMSTTGDLSLPQATPEVTAVLLSPPPPGREGIAEHGVQLFRAIGSPGFPFDEAMVRDVAGRCFDRGNNPDGVARQLMAILASGDRTEHLAKVKAPTVVIHGKADPLVPYESGVATAKAIAGAKLVSIDGMGHDMPVGVWPTLLDEICAVAAKG